MSEVEIDLWPSTFEVPRTELPDTPDTILKEQAERLGEKTNHLVEAIVEAPEYAKYLTDRIRLAFYLVAPRLGNYSYRLFTVEYELTYKGQEVVGYPVTVLSDEEIICENKEKFMEVLKRMFASNATLKIISSMMNG